MRTRWRGMSPVVAVCWVRPPAPPSVRSSQCSNRPRSLRFGTKASRCAALPARRNSVWDQAAEFGRQYLSGAHGLDRIAALGARLIAAAPIAGLPLFAGWRAMPLADDVAAQALQVMFVLRELRAGVHFNALTISGISPVEAHMLSKGRQYTATFGWPEPFADGADKKDRYAEVEQATNRRMAEIFAAALKPAEAEELARLSTAALAALKASVPGSPG